MREILFRGKTEEANRWIFGDLEHDSDGDVQILGTHSVFARSVDPETVGQFTGLTDKNDVKIFEGDIVRHKDEIYEIGYSVPQARFLAFLPNGVFNPVAMQDCEVIGNIHDNTELIGGNQNDYEQN